MTLNVNERKDNGITVVELTGELDSSTVSAFSAKLEDITDKMGFGKYVVDMSRLTFISSAGWTLFVNQCKLLRAAGGDLKFAAMQENAERIYNLVGIDIMIKSYPSVELAVKSFSAV